MVTAVVPLRNSRVNQPAISAVLSEKYTDALFVYTPWAGVLSPYGLRKEYTGTLPTIQPSVVGQIGNFNGSTQRVEVLNTNSTLSNGVSILIVGTHTVSGAENFILSRDGGYLDIGSFRTLFSTPYGGSPSNRIEVIGRPDGQNSQFFPYYVNGNFYQGDTNANKFATTVGQYNFLAAGLSGAFTADGTTTNIRIGFGSGVYANANVALAVVFPRRLSNADLQSLSTNPWQIFQQPRYVQTDSTPSPTSRTFFVPRKKVMSRQPAGPAAAIDWGNPITRGLASAYIPTAAQYRSFDLATNTRDLTTNADFLPPYRPGAAGFALDSTDTNYVWSIQFDPVALRGYPKTGYAAVTVFSLFESRTTNQFGVIYGGGQDGTYYGRLVVSSDATIAFIAASNNATLHPKAPLVADTLYAATGIQSFTRSYRALYVNGHLAETRTESINNLNTGFIAGSIYNVQLRRIKLYCGYVWVRELSAAEIKSLSDNPWQIFKQDRLSPALAEDGKVYAPFMS